MTPQRNKTLTDLKLEHLKTYVQRILYKNGASSTSFSGVLALRTMSFLTNSGDVIDDEST